MIFVGLVIIMVIVYFVYLLKQSDNYKFSKMILIIFLFSILANVSLAQNYTQSLIPGIQDGIEISNKLAYWIITDESWGSHWSKALFRTAYNYSTVVAGITLILFSVSLMKESKRKLK